MIDSNCDTILAVPGPGALILTDEQAEEILAAIKASRKPTKAEMEARELRVQALFAKPSKA